MDFKRSDEITYTKPPLELFLRQYNGILAALLAENMDNFAYLTSPVINRMEAQTHFYEKIQKYMQIRDLLTKEGLDGVLLTGEDVFFYDELKAEFRARVRKEASNRGGILGKLKTSVKKIQLLRFLIKAAIYLYKTLRLIRVSRTMPPRKTGYASIIRTYFDFRSTDANGKLREEYFGPFAVDLAKHEKLLIIYKLFHEGSHEQFRKLHKEQTDFDSCIIEYFLSTSSLIKAFREYCSGKIRLKKKIYFEKIDITSMLQRALDNEYYNLQGINVYVEREIAGKVFALKPERIYMPYENQTWEKVYPFVKKRVGVGNTKIIGFQHTGLSYKLLQHFPAREEKDLPLYPDKLLTVGKIYQRLLKEKAFFPCEIAEGAALRHSKYVKDGAFVLKEPHKQLKGAVTYAFSYDTLKYRSIIGALFKIFGNSAIKLYFKIHPDYEENQMMKMLGIKTPENVILAQKIPWTTIYDNSDCVIYDDNSIGIEGMINGVRTYMFDYAEPIYECDRMYYFDEWDTTITIEGLKALKNDIENKRYDPWYDVEKMKKYLNLYYNAYSKEKYFSNYF